MRRGALLVWALIVVGCTHDTRPTSLSSSSTAPSTSTAPTLVTTTAPPTTASPLAPIDGCPDPGPLARPDPNRPSYVATAAVDVAGSSVTGTLAVRFTPDLPTDELVFRLWPNAPALAAAGVREDVGAVSTSAGEQLVVDRPDETTVHVALPSPLRAGTSISVSMPYSLTVPGPTDDRVAHDHDTMRLGSFLPLLAWEPGVGWARDPATSAHAAAATSPIADYDVA